MDFENISSMTSCILNFLELDTNQSGINLVTEEPIDLHLESILTNIIVKRRLADLNEKKSSRLAESSEKSSGVKKEPENWSIDTDSLGPDEFRLYFRVSQAVSSALLSKLEEFISTHDSNESVREMPKEASVRSQLLLTLSYLGSSKTVKELSESFQINEVLLTVVVKSTAEVLYEVMSGNLSWPDKKQACESACGFLETTHVPNANVMGVLDVTHINVEVGQAEEKLYTNVDGETTILLQAVCDHKLKFFHCCAGWPGSVDKHTILQQSGLIQLVKDNQDLFLQENYALIGGKGYPLYNWLLTPYADPSINLTDQLIKFNFHLGLTQTTITHAFLRLRRRFPRLEQMTRDFQLEVVIKIVLLCCAIHNFCIDLEDTELFTDSKVVEKKVESTLYNFKPSKNVLKKIEFLAKTM